jgi:hypothetical protein
MAIETDAMKVVDLITSFLNNYSWDKEGFIKAMANQHRTLQQTFMNLCLAWIKHNAKLEEGWFDGRNEAAVQICKEIVENVPDVEYQLPLI